MAVTKTSSLVHARPKLNNGEPDTIPLIPSLTHFPLQSQVPSGSDEDEPGPRKGKKAGKDGLTSPFLSSLTHRSPAAVTKTNLVHAKARRQAKPRV